MQYNDNHGHFENKDLRIWILGEFLTLSNHLLREAEQTFFFKLLLH